MELGITPEGRRHLSALFETLAAYLSNGIRLDESTKLSGGRNLTVAASYGDGRLSFVFSGDKPIVAIQKLFFTFRGEVEGIQVQGDRVNVLIDGLPDVSINLK